MHITCVSISRRSVCGVTQVCHLCKYFTTMRKIGINSRFRLLFIIALISLLSWGIVVPFCIVNRFAMTKAKHTNTNKDCITLIYTWERNTESLLWGPLFALQIFHHWCTLLLSSFLYRNQFKREWYSSLLLSICLFVLILGIKTHLFRTILHSEEWRDNEPTDFLLFSTRFLSASNSILRILSHLLFKSKGSVMNRSFDGGVTI